MLLSSSVSAGRIYIGGLPRDVQDRDIDAVVSKYAKIERVWIARNPPGFAYVTVSTDAEADEVIRNCDGTEIAGTRVRFEKPRSEGPKPRGSYTGGDRDRGGYRGPPADYGSRGPPPPRYDDRGRDDRGGYRPEPRRYDDRPEPRRYEEPPRRSYDDRDRDGPRAPPAGPPHGHVPRPYEDAAPPAGGAGGYRRDRSRERDEEPRREDRYREDREPGGP